MADPISAGVLAGSRIADTIGDPILQAFINKRKMELEESKYADDKQYKAAMLDIARQKVGSRSPLTALTTDLKAREMAEKLYPGGSKEVIDQATADIKAQYGFSDSAPEIPSQPATPAVDPMAAKQAGDATQVTGTIPGTNFKIKTNATNAAILAQTPQGKQLLGSTKPEDADVLTEGVPAAPSAKESSAQADALAQGTPSTPDADVQISALLKEAATGKAMRPGVEPIPRQANPLQDIALAKTSPKEITPDTSKMSARERYQMEQANKLDPDTQKAVRTKNANKMSIISSIDNSLKSLEKGDLPEPEKLAIARGMLKTLNSSEGADAIGVEEAKRLGDLIEYHFPYADGANTADMWKRFVDPADRNFGRNMDGFFNQARTISSNLKGSVDETRKQIGDKPLYAGKSASPKEESRPTQFESLEQAESANLPKGTRIIINGRPAIVE